MWLLPMTTATLSAMASANSRWARTTAWKERSVHIDGHAEGEFRVTGNLDVATGATARISIEAANVTVKGNVEGSVNVKDKLTLGKNAKLSGDIVVRRLQIEDGASLNGHVRMGDIEQHPSGG
jgi:cytoskeletal protein CcmA (bactofilin family)